MGYFNFFDEWAMDPKVQSLPEEMQRRHAMLLCLRNIGDTSETPDDEVATFMRISMEETERTKELFRRKSFISGNGWYVTNWDKRQSGQSESYARVKRWRALHRNGRETLHETDCNVTEARGETALARKNLLTNELTNTPPLTPPSGGSGASERVVSASPRNPEAEVKRLEALAESRWPLQEAARHIRDLCGEFDHRLVREIMDQDYAANPKKFRYRWVRKGCQNEAADGWHNRIKATPEERRQTPEEEAAEKERRRRLSRPREATK